MGTGLNCTRTKFHEAKFARVTFMRKSKKIQKNKTKKQFNKKQKKKKLLTEGKGNSDSENLKKISKNNYKKKG